MSFHKLKLIFLKELFESLNCTRAPGREASAQMSKFKLAIKLLYGHCQTIATPGGGFPIIIMYVKRPIFMMNISKFTSRDHSSSLLFIVIWLHSCRGRVYYQERDNIINWATFAISSYKGPLFLCVALPTNTCNKPSTRLLNKFNKIWDVFRECAV